MVEKAKRKRAGTVAQGAQTTKRRRSKGMLKGISDMPMEIVYEILSHLYPADILSLSRTTKHLRSLLMSRESGELVWKRCRENVPGFPDCPADLNEPQYAELAFGKACYNCGRNHVNNITAWHARTRLCTKCLKEDYHKPADRFPAIDDDLLDFLPCALKDGCWVFESHTAYLWMTERMTLDQAGRVLWLERMVAERAPIVQHADACFAWETSMLQLAFEERLSEVQARVKKLDYRGEFERPQVDPDTGALLPDPVDDPEIQQICSKKFGPKAWDKIDSIINDKIFARFFLRSATVCQSALDHVAAIRDSFVGALPQAQSWIPLINLVFSPGYGETFNKCISDAMEAPQDANVLDIPLERFLDYHANWVKSSTKRLVELIRQAFADFGSSAQDPTTGIDLEDHEQCVALVERPTIFFRCVNCSNPFRYPNVLSHDCAYAWADVEDDIPLSRMIMDKADRLPWNHRNVIVFKPRDFFAATNFVKYCGLDPETTKMKDLDQFIFTCRVCIHMHHVPPSKPAMLGSRALYHCLGIDWFLAVESVHERLRQNYSTTTFDVRDFSTTFLPVESGARQSQIAELLEDARKDILPSDDVDPREYHRRQWRVCCTQCPVTGSLSTLEAHARTAHADVDFETCLKICRGDFQTEFVVEEVWVPLSF